MSGFLKDRDGGYCNVDAIVRVNVREVVGQGWAIRGVLTDATEEHFGDIYATAAEAHEVAALLLRAHDPAGV